MSAFATLPSTAARAGSKAATVARRRGAFGLKPRRRMRGSHSAAESTEPMIAVGTDIAASPPHRSKRALLAHWAPASGGGVEPSIREGVQHAGRWQPLGPETAHALPVQSRALAAAPQRSVPVHVTWARKAATVSVLPGTA